MAPRTVRRRRRTRGRAAQNSAGASATGLLSQITALVTENKTLTRQNYELNSILAGISQSLERFGGRPARRGRPRARGAKASTGRRPERPRHSLRRITDPATLERRRAALVKARQVLAAKRAAKKRGR